MHLCGNHGLHFQIHRPTVVDVRFNTTTTTSKNYLTKNDHLFVMFLSMALRRCTRKKSSRIIARILPYVKGIT